MAHIESSWKKLSVLVPVIVSPTDVASPIKGVDPTFLRNTHFAKKHKKKGLKKMQASNAKAMSAHAEAIKALVKSKEVKSKFPKGISPKLNRLAYIAHSKLGKRARAHIAKQLRLCWPKAKAKTKDQTKARLQLQLQFQLRLPKVHRPLQKLQSRYLCLPT
ncbi:hypothetical protein P7K49_000202 [Saguinus oedipus]|uniref:60S ribosomal protein L29 n=1 Tax=Saguinus oedipus TaxID=9490 RepID=A0ABQ9WB19_SAGOE|nr:hypothetical protein P7K49_000202 [Saguinus oedipus]